MIIGTNRYDLNGRVGAATSFDHARGRYTVELDAGADESEIGKRKVKPGNLAIADK